MTQNVVYIRKVKKSESKSQPQRIPPRSIVVVYIRKVKKSESKSQRVPSALKTGDSCVYP